MEGFKVFRTNNRGELMSCIVKGKAKVYYKKGKKNRPPKWLRNVGCRITFFETLNDAIYWKDTLKGFGTKTCQIWGVKTQEYVLRNSNLPRKLQIDSLKEGRIKFEDISKRFWPEGTLMAEVLIPTEKVGRNELRRKRLKAKKIELDQDL